MTDAQARPIYAGGDLTATPHGRVGKSLQTKIGNEGDYAETDVGFHLIGDQFDGPVSRLNVVQGDGVLNNGAFKALERKLKDHIEAGTKVHVKVYPEYEGLSIRPSTFRIEYQIGDGVIKTKSYANTPSI